VLNPIYENILSIAADAASTKNEAVLIRCIQSMASVAEHMRGVTVEVHRQKTAPLMFSACFYLGKCIDIALESNLVDATRAGITGLEQQLLNQKAEVSTSEMESVAVDCLFKIASGGYKRDDTLLCYPAVEALLKSALKQIDTAEYIKSSPLQDLLSRIARLVPAEILYDVAGSRKLEAFPAYNLGFEASVPRILEVSSSLERIAAEISTRNVNPFEQFLSCAEDVRHHYRELSKLDFGNGLLRKWIVDSIFASARVHLAVVKAAPEGARGYTKSVERSMRNLLSWVSAFYPPGSAARHHFRDALNGLAAFGIRSLDEGLLEVAEQCVRTLSTMSTSAINSGEPYSVGDTHVGIEIIARAADAVGEDELAKKFRNELALPPTLPTNERQTYLEAKENRMGHFERALRDAGRRTYMRDDPVEELHSLLAERGVGVIRMSAADD
jgi:hypothetical protein